MQVDDIGPCQPIRVLGHGTSGIVEKWYTRGMFVLLTISCTAGIRYAILSHSHTAVHALPSIIFCFGLAVVIQLAAKISPTFWKYFIVVSAIAVSFLLARF